MTKTTRLGLAFALTALGCSGGNTTPILGDAPDGGGTALPDAGGPADAGPPDDASADIDAGADSGGGGGGTSDAGDAPTFTVDRGALLYSYDFSASTFAPDWVVVGATWSLADQHLVGVRGTAEKDPNIGHLMAVDRVVIQFRFSSAGSTGIRLNHAAPDPQHLVNVVMTPSGVALNQMSGWGTTTTSTTLDKATATLDPSAWHTGVLEVYDSSVTFSVDGTKLVTATTVDQSATPRNQLIFEANTPSVAVNYDDVKVWAAIKR